MRVRKRISIWLGAVAFLLLTGMLTGKTAEAAEKKVVKTALGGTHSAAIDSEGNLWMWGSNAYGAIGNGKSGENMSVGTPIKIMSGVSQVSLSPGTWNSSGAVTRDGNLYMWGNNRFGQLGDGTTTDSLKPKKIMSGVSQVIVGNRRTAAIKKDGSLWVWGSGLSGGLDIDVSKTPVKLLDNVVQADLGTDHGGAVKSDGSLWMWGDDDSGQQGTSEIGSQPKKVMDGVKQVSLGHSHTAVVKTDGSLWMWGDNSEEQLGIGASNKETRTIDTPMKIMSSGVSQVSLGHWGSGIVKTDGSLWMTGYNYYISFHEYSWKKIATGARLVELGDSHTAMIKNDGSLWTWGGGWRGQLGDGVVNRDGYNVKNPTRISVGGTAASGKGTTTIGAGVKKAIPKKNSTFTSSSVTYKVTKSDAKKGTVTLVKGDKKKSSVVIPATVKKNGYTFKVTQISSKAFYKNTKLKKVTIGKNITSIGTKAFQGCKSLKTIQVKSTSLKKVGKNALSGIHKKATVKVPSKKLKAYQKLLKKKGQASTVKIKK